ncbi:MAG: DUF1376 domain-containing protein [Spirochaetales bacterium]|nr:DUF1376 domain-containing protein [Spirochaetales bacterium]
MKTDIWMPLYISDFLSDTFHLSAEETGAYMLIIMNYWKRGSIGGDIERISRSARITPDMTQALLEEYFYFADGEWKHTRIEKELKIAKDNKEKRAERAKKAAEARWSKENAPGNAQSMGQAIPEDMREECPSPSSSPTSTQVKKHLTSHLQKGAERSGLDDVIDYWNSKGNLPKALMACNLPNPGQLASIVENYETDYVKEAIDRLSENWDELEYRFRPGSIKTFLENSVPRWHDFQPEKPEQSEEERAAFEKILDEVFG